MQCQESSKILEAYLDGEIDLMRSVELEDHLATCADCRQNLEGQRALKGLLQNGGLRFAAPAGLKDEILGSLRSAQVKATEEDETTSRRHWIFLPAVRWAAAAVLFIALAGGLMFWSRGQAEQKLAAQVVDNHIRSLLAGHLADVASSDQHTVKPWFTGKISFSPSVADFTAKGFPLTGGRLDYMDNQTVAALIYQRRAHIINVFIYPEAGRSSPAIMQQRGFNLIHWAGGGMEYWVVSDLNVSELQELADMLRALSS